MKKPSILIVDDEEDIRINLTAALSAEGYDVHCADGGVAAEEILRTGQPDLVMLDIMMPGLDGYELCRRIKEEGSKSPAVVFASALRKTRNKVEGLDLGADDYITKPFNMAELKAKLRALFRAQENKRQLQRLVDFSHSINAIDLKSVGEAVAARFPGLVGSDRFSLFYADESEGALRLVADNHIEKTDEGLSIAKADSMLMSDAIDGSGEIYIEDFGASKYSAESQRPKYTDGYAMCIPLRSGGEAVGVLNISGNNSGFFAAGDLSVPRLLAEMIGSSLGNCRMHARINLLAVTDGLTKVYNHQHFHQRLDLEFERAHRFEQDLSCIMLDIDFFKKINDTYGHQAGDAVLRSVAARLLNHLRKIDIVARYGGEEFALLLPQTSIKAAVAVAERIREDIEASPVETIAGLVKVTASLGVATTKAKDIKKGVDLIKKADESLYDAKHEGRNRTRAQMI